MKLTRELGNPFKPILGKYGNYEIYEDGKTTQLEADQAQIAALERAAMERMTDKIEHDFYLEHIYPYIKPGEQDDAIVIHIPKKRVPSIMREFKSLPSELLGKGDKINKEANHGRRADQKVRSGQCPQ